MIKRHSKTKDFDPGSPQAQLWDFATGSMLGSRGASSDHSWLMTHYLLSDRYVLTQAEISGAAGKVALIHVVKPNDLLGVPELAADFIVDTLKLDRTTGLGTIASDSLHIPRGASTSGFTVMAHVQELVTPRPGQQTESNEALIWHEANSQDYASFQLDVNRVLARRA